MRICCWNIYGMTIADDIYYPQTMLVTPQYLIMKTMLKVIMLLLVVLQATSQNITMVAGGESIVMSVNGSRSQQFYQYKKEMDCGMPELYIFLDSTHNNYLIQAEGCQINAVEGVRSAILAEFSPTCTPNQCNITLNNLCGLSPQINEVQVSTSIGHLEYLINCNPDQFYKPFEWGLLLLIMITTLVLTLGSLYSRAWSYGGVGYAISNKAILIFNLALLFFIILAYLVPDAVSLLARIAGSVIGALGVGVCISEIIWLSHNKNYLRKVYRWVRLIDVISYGVGLLFIPLYWLLNGQWMINDIMAICSTVALMKLLKVTSLSIAVNLLGSLLFLQILVGVVVHYVLQLSYNNYVINLFQNPIMLVMPSITPELYRRCAWLPITAALFPGLALSYLRRFDKTRGTYVYFLIGLASFYFGSLCWMIVDMETVHSLPFAIISQPITMLIVGLQAFRRNEFKTLWRGSFHDEELSQGQPMLHKETEIVNTTPSAYADLTGNLKMDGNSSSGYEAVRISQDFKL